MQTNASGQWWRSSAYFVAVGVIYAAIVLALGRFSDDLQAAMLGSEQVLDLPADDQYFERITLDTKLDLLGASDKDVWAIGDSSCLFGLAPGPFAEGAGLSLVNLGAFGTFGVQGHAWLLEQMFERHDAPQAVLLWLHPETMATSAESCWEAGSLQWAQRWQGSGQAASDVPFVAINDAVGGSLRLRVLDHAGWGVQRMGELLSPASSRKRMSENSGWFPTVPQRFARYNHPARLHPSQIPWLRKIADACLQHQTQLFLYVMPTIEGGPVSVEDHLRSRDEIAAAIPEASLLVSTRNAVPWQEMQSPTHYAASLAKAESRNVGVRLAELVRARFEATTP